MLGQSYSVGCLGQDAPLLAGIGDALAIVGSPGRVEIQGLLHVLKLTLHACTAIRRKTS